MMRLSPNPLVFGVELALHLVLPRHAAARPDPVLEIHRGAVSRRSTSGFRSAARRSFTPNANTLITTVRRGDPRVSASTRAPTWPRSSAPASSRSTRGRPRRRSRSACRRLQTMRRIVLPQAMRVIIPPTGNETISMLKNTSLVSVLALHRAAVLGPADLRGQLQADPAADRRELLVPGDDERPVRRPVLHRAPLRARVHPGGADASCGALARLPRGRGECGA